MLAKTLLAFAFLAGPTQAAMNAYEEATAYEVYAAILPLDPLRVAHAKGLVIRRETTSFQMCLRPDREFETKVGPAIANYVELNKKQWVLQARLSIDSPYQFLETSKFSALLDKGGWDEYYRQYPASGGLIALSAVGFNGDKTIAVVWIVNSCGGTCGVGTFHVLEKVDGKWQPLKWKGSSCAWAS
jgi:hypothetical protein